jgi:hypothetical protein
MLYRFRLAFCKVQDITLEAVTIDWHNECKREESKMDIHFQSYLPFPSALYVLLPYIRNNPIY